VWRGAFSDRFLPEPEDVDLRVRFVIPSRRGDPWGRLSVAVGRSGLKTGDPGYRMILTATGPPSGPSVTDIQEDMDLAHVWIVKGFTSITTEEMHARWGLQSDS
jgi:hypothetical protein